MGLNIFAFIVLLVIILSVVGFVIFLGMWPMLVAKKNNHPQLAAITVGSWVALLAGGVLWPLIIIWAHYDYGTDKTPLELKGETK